METITCDKCKKTFSPRNTSYINGGSRTLLENRWHFDLCRKCYKKIKQKIEEK